MPTAASVTWRPSIFRRLIPVTGPIFVEGAEPGDALKVTIEEFKPSGFGWTANIPGFGLLRRRFHGAGAQRLEIRRVVAGTRALRQERAGAAEALRGDDRQSRRPKPGLHSVVPPRRVGGNLDIRDLAAGTVLYLPVEVVGALFSVGDTHAAQGDGEVCGTAIESPMDVVLKLDLVKDARLKMPRFTTPGPVTRHLDAKGYEVTTGVGPDPDGGAAGSASRRWSTCSRGATTWMPCDAYMLCSVCGDLEDQRDRRHAQLGGVVLFSAGRVRVMVGACPEAPVRWLSRRRHPVAPPSVLSDISPARGEISSFDFAARPARWRLAKPKRTGANLPLAGEMSGCDRGGAKGLQLSAAGLSAMNAAPYPHGLQPRRLRSRRGRRTRSRIRSLLRPSKKARRCASPANPAPGNR